jgi:uncharacterized MAPEG superfamily protein
VITIYCLIVLIFFPIVLALGSIPFRIQQESLPNIRQPREQASRLVGAGARITHAQNNSWEALILFASTLLVAFLSQTDLNSLALPSMLFVALRITYTIFYLFDLGWARFLTFLSGMGMLIWILVISLSQG